MADYPVTLEHTQAHVRVNASGETVAESRLPLLVREKGHDPVYYLPAEDVRKELFERTEHRTHCPWKGDATHWTVAADGGELENAAWSYESPKPQVAGLKGYFAFYPGKVLIQAEPED